MKRRYKSGIPLNTDRNDDDPIEETYLKSFYDSINKTSKDDSDISLTSSLSSKTTTANDNQKDARLYHSSFDGLMLSDGILPNSNNSHASKTTSSHRHHHKHSHHQRHQSAHNVTNGNRSQDGNKTTSSADANTSAKAICHPSCWCNNLVEVTIRYPTKVVSYVTLIDNNNCVAHDLNPAAFDQSQRKPKPVGTNESASGVESNHVDKIAASGATSIDSDAKKNMSTNMVNSLSAIAASAGMSSMVGLSKPITSDFNTYLRTRRWEKSDTDLIFQKNKGP